MRLSLFVLWAIVGWCATPWLWYPSYPDPAPDPWPLNAIVVSRIIGVVAGIAGGFVFTQLFDSEPLRWITGKPQPDPWMPVIYAAASTVGAFLGAHLLVDIYGLAKSRRIVRKGSSRLSGAELPRQ